MRTLTLRRALLASARVRLHPLEVRFIASPTPGSDRRHRPRDRPHPCPLRDRHRRRSDRGRGARGHAHRDRAPARPLDQPTRGAQSPDRSEPHLRRAAATGRRRRFANVGPRTGAHPSHRARRHHRIDAVGHCRALWRERRVHRRGQPDRESKLDLRGPAARDPRRPGAPAFPAPRGSRRWCLGAAAGGIGRARRHSGFHAVGHRRALQRQRWIHRRGQPPR